MWQGLVMSVHRTFMKLRSVDVVVESDYCKMLVSPFPTVQPADIVTVLIDSF